MYIGMNVKKDKIWCVTAYGLVGTDTHRFNRVFNIIAKTAEEAIKVLQTDPDNDLIIVSVNCKGPVGLKYCYGSKTV